MIFLKTQGSQTSFKVEPIDKIDDIVITRRGAVYTLKSV